MAKLYFKVEADYDKVIRLREEIKKLETQLKQTDTSSSPQSISRLEEQLQRAKTEMTDMVSEASRAGAQIAGGFKQKIYDASQAVNDLSQKIIQQRAIVRRANNEAKAQGEAYRKALKNNPSGADAILLQYESAMKVAHKEKDMLFLLTQEQATARLSVKKLRDEYNLYKSDTKGVTSTNEEMKDSFGGVSISMKKAFGVIGGTAALKELSSQIIRVRGEFQEMETSIETMVGKNMANKLIPQIKELAKISPLTMSDMVGAEKMMLGFNIQAEDTMKYLKALSDLSMGSSTKFNSLTLAFSQMSAAGKLMGQDLNQMINAGFNPLQVIAEKTGKSISQLKEDMSKGAVSAKMVQDAFIAATSEGGKFFNMSENASKTINGQISMMQDAMDAAFNDMGKASEGLIVKSISGVTSLIENYQTVGKVLLGLVATYGTYKAAVVAVTVVENLRYQAALAHMAGLTKMKAVTEVLTAQTKSLFKVLSLNPYALAAASAVALVVAISNMKTEEERLQEIEEKYNEEKQKVIENTQKQIAETNKLVSVAGDEALSTDVRRDAIKKLIKQYPEILSKYKTEYDALCNIRDIKKEIAALEAENDPNKTSNQIRMVQAELDALYNKTLHKDHYGNMKGNIGLLSTEEHDKYLFLQKKLQKLKAKENKENAESYFNDLTKIERKHIDGGIKYRKNLLAKMSSENSQNGMIGGINYSKDEILGQIDMLEKEIARRDKKKKTPVQWAASYKKAYDDALKNLKEFEQQKSTLSDEEFQKEHKKRKDAVEKAKRLYDQYKPDESQKTSNTKQESDQREKNEHKAAEALLVLQSENDRLSVEIMREGHEKRMAEINLEFEERKKAIEKQAKTMASLTKDGKLTPEQQAQIDEANRINQKRKENRTADVYKDERDSMLEYLSKYGNVNQKKQATRESYEDKIKKADTEGMKKTLTKQLEEALAAIDMEQLEDSLDWSKVFGNLGKISEGSLLELREKLTKFVQETKGLSVESKKEIIKSLEDIDKELSSRSPFESFGKSMNVLRDTSAELKAAQEAYNKALKEGTKEEQANAKETLNAARDKKRAAQIKATEDLHAMSGKMGEYSDAGKSMLSIIEKFGANPPEWMHDFIGGFDKMLGGLNEIDLTNIGSIIQGSLDAISGALDSVFSLGGLINWNGSNAEKVQKTIDRLTERNEALQQSIEDLTDEMKDSKGTKSVLAYKQAVEYQNETNQNYLDIAKAQAGYHGKHHSWNYYWKGFGGEDLEWIKDNVKEDFNGDIFSLTPEEMKMLRGNVELWEAIKKSGKGGYGEGLVEKLNAYIDQAGKVEELTQQLYEGLTGITFDGMYDSFIDNLMDMKYSAEDAAEDISQYFMKAMLSNRIGELFSEKLKGWWENFGKAMENDGTLDETERENLLKEYLGYVDEAQKIRDEVAKATGYDKIAGDTSQQEASKKGFAAASQEDIGELNGRFTAIQISNDGINSNVASIYSYMLNLGSLHTSTNTYLLEIRNMFITANAYLEDIAKYTKFIFTNFSTRFDDLIKNTKHL